MCPNGLFRSDQELKQLENFFACVAPTIDNFAKEKGLKTEKYEKGAATWVLEFARKKGGVATITIGLDERSNRDFHVTSIWFIDEFETQMRHTKFEPIGIYNKDENLKKFSDLLERSFEAIKSWSFSDLDRHDGPMEIWKKKWLTNEAFEQAGYQGYPTLDV